MNLSDLLPDPTEQPTCTAFSQGIGVDPAGSAFHAHLVVLVEAPLPWPKPVSEHPVLQGLFSLMRGAAVPTRILACEPFRSGQRKAAGDEQLGNASAEGVGVVVFRFDGARYVRTDMVVTATELLDTVEAECATSTQTTPGLAPSPNHAGRQSLLVCTQGSHDICCGDLGEPLAAHVESTYPDVDVFRVSHTGGHRFAPTALSMPDGRMWAYLDDEMVSTIVHRTGSPGAVAGRCRGWIGAKTGAAQAAERTVFAKSDWQWDTAARTVEVTETDPESPGSWDVVVSSVEQRWDIAVEVSRHIPTIACSQPGGLPAKPGREYATTSIEQSAEGT